MSVHRTVAVLEATEKIEVEAEVKVGGKEKLLSYEEELYTILSGRDRAGERSKEFLRGGFL